MSWRVHSAYNDWNEMCPETAAFCHLVAAPSIPAEQRLTTTQPSVNSAEHISYRMTNLTLVILGCDAVFGHFAIFRGHRRVYCRGILGWAAVRAACTGGRKLCTIHWRYLCSVTYTAKCVTGSNPGRPRGYQVDMGTVGMGWNRGIWAFGGTQMYTYCMYTVCYTKR